MEICPYWRRFIILNQKDGSREILILCGKEDPDTLPYPDIPDFGARLSKCPWYSPLDVAYTHPEIGLLRPGFVRPRVVEAATFPGIKGIAELEEKWEEVARKFRNGQIYTRNRKGEKFP